MKSRILASLHVGLAHFSLRGYLVMGCSLHGVPSEGASTSGETYHITVYELNLLTEKWS